MICLSKRTIWILAAIYAAPIATYAVNFGLTFSSDHTRWAEFGSAMAGIYAPIVAWTTLTVLLFQVSLQKQFNDHEYSQAHISQARADIEFYASQLSEKLDSKAIQDHTFRSVLHSNFQPLSADDLDSDSLRTLAANIDSSMPGIKDMWFGVYQVLTGLAAGNTKTFEMTLNSSLQKLIAILSFETCVALDNLHRARVQGRIKLIYRFSPILEPKRMA
jgi:hypothetical protein